MIKLSQFIKIDLTEKFEKEQFRDFEIMLPDDQTDETVLNDRNERTVNNETNAENDGTESENNSGDENETVEDEENVESD
jgi:hypothetical protein